MYRGFKVVQHMGETPFYVVLDGGGWGRGGWWQWQLSWQKVYIRYNWLQYLHRSPQNDSIYSSVQTHFWFSEGSLGADLILWHRNATDLWFCQSEPPVFNCYSCHAAVLATKRLHWRSQRNGALLKGNMEAVKIPPSTQCFCKKGWGFNTCDILRVVGVVNC